MLNNFFIFDTNVLISAAFNQNSTSGQAIKKVLEEKGYFLFSDATFDEFFEVLNRRKFDKYLSIGKKKDFITHILGASQFFNPKIKIDICSAPKDNMFLSLALECQAMYIVSGDKHLLELHPFENIPILSPKEFLTTNY